MTAKVKNKPKKKAAKGHTKKPKMTPPPSVASAITTIEDVLRSCDEVELIELAKDVCVALKNTGRYHAAFVAVGLPEGSTQLDYAFRAEIRAHEDQSSVLDMAGQLEELADNIRSRYAHNSISRMETFLESGVKLVCDEHATVTELLNQLNGRIGDMLTERARKNQESPGPRLRDEDAPPKSPASTRIDEDDEFNDLVQDEEVTVPGNHVDPRETMPSGCH